MEKAHWSFSDHSCSAIFSQLSLNTPEQMKYHCHFLVILLSDFLLLFNC